MSDDVLDRYRQYKDLPLCERCGKGKGTIALTFTYRGEPYETHFYCPPCGDIMEIEGIKYVEEQGAKLKAAGILAPGEDELR